MLAFTFPGQGSQRPGMGRPWLDDESWELVGEASEIAERDVGKLLLDADADELRDTRNAQLTTFVSSLMVLDAAERLGIEASYCAGHSLGEYTALTATGALQFADGVQLVISRADAMYDAGIDNPGTMAAVLGLDDDQVDVACRRADADVWIANYNAPGQVVIAGSPDGVTVATEHAKALGAKKIIPLQVSGAFHTPYMISARDRLREAIAAAGPRDAEVPIVSNVDALPHQLGTEWPSLLSAQLSSPVRWKHVVLELVDSGVDEFVELGPGARAHRDGQAHRNGGAADLRRHARGPRPADRVRPARGAGTANSHRRRASLRQRATRRQHRCRHLHPGCWHRRWHGDRGRHGARPRRRSRGPLPVRRRAAELHRRRHRTGHATATDRLATHVVG